jgi:hypothetical protein
MLQPDRYPTPFLKAWAAGTRLTRFMSELGFTRHGPALSGDGTAAVLRHVREATEAEYAARSAGYLRVEVFREANERAGAILQDLKTHSPSDYGHERFLEAILYAAHGAETVRRQREFFPLPEPQHVSVTKGLGLDIVDTQRGILCGAHLVQTHFAETEPENPGTIAWKVLQEHVADVWPRHLSNVEAGNV